MTRLTQQQKVEIKNYIVDTVKTEGQVDSFQVYDKFPGLDQRAILQYLIWHVAKNDWGLESNYFFDDEKGVRGRAGWRFLHL